MYLETSRSFSTYVFKYILYKNVWKALSNPAGIVSYFNFIFYLISFSIAFNLHVHMIFSLEITSQSTSNWTWLAHVCFRYLVLIVQEIWSLCLSWVLSVLYNGFFYQSKSCHFLSWKSQCYEIQRSCRVWGACIVFC